MDDTVPTEKNSGTDGTEDVVKFNDSMPSIQKRKSSFNQQTLPKLNLKLGDHSQNEIHMQPSNASRIASLSPDYPMAAVTDYDKDLEIFKIAFEVFDPEKTGFVTKDDIIAVTVGMRKDFQLVNEILDQIQSLKTEDYDPNLISFGEFATLIWQVEQKQREAKQEILQLSPGYDNILGESVLSPYP